MSFAVRALFARLAPTMRRPIRLAAALALGVPLALPLAGQAQAQAQVSVQMQDGQAQDQAALGLTAFRQALAEGAAGNREVAAYYRAHAYAPVWTGQDAASQARLQAFFAALEAAPLNGLPTARYGADALRAQAASVRTVTDLGRLEAALSRRFALFAHDLQAGVLVPSRVVEDIKRDPKAKSAAAYLRALAQSDDPRAYIRSLAPQSNEYRRLMKARLELQRTLEGGGWGPTVPERVLKPGAEGAAVIALRDRLVAMGYLDRSATRIYDGALQQAVQAFQTDHGLEPDGVAGPDTMAQINVGVAERMKSVLVAMERERWLPHKRGKRHVLVNLADFSARILDDDVVTFRTRAVVGMNAPDRRSPEFSDVMEMMVINPTWHVPRSIAVKEYLPQLQQNPNAVGYLQIFDGSGRQVSRAAVDFNAYTPGNFPFDLKQPPSQGNALGRVKFLFPNRWNIYLHDTPSKYLFARQKRAFSHGCIRLQRPYEFAYALLARQEADPVGYFKSILHTRQETTVPLKHPVPVHLIYRTAFTRADGTVEYRDDVYGRDAQIWAALTQAGVSLSVPGV